MMKRNMGKFFSVLLALVMICSVVVLPASALDGGTVEIAFSAEKHTGADTTGATADDIYALTISFKNDHPINAFVMPVYYDSSVFTPIDGTDMSIMEWGYTVDFSAGLTGVGYEAKGDLADTRKFNNTLAAPADRVVNNRGAIAALGNGSAKKTLDIVTCDPSNPDHTHFWGGMSKDSIGAIYLNYETGDKTCNIQAYNEFTPFVTLFFKANSGVTQDQINNARFGYYSESTKDCFDSTVEGDVNKFFFSADSTSYAPAKTAGECKIGGSEVKLPSVVKSAGQIKMTATSATTVDDAFQLRIISKITSADWDANFAKTAVEGATANYITKVGMVAYTGVVGDYNLDDAKAAIAAGESNGNYYYGETDYIKHAEGGDATFGTILKCTHGSDKLQNDPICLGFVTYVDAAGQTQTIYYAETYTAPIVSNYDTLASTYAQNYWGK